MRYTEARMTEAAMQLLRDIEKDTVSFSFNFDDTLKEPDLAGGQKRMRCDHDGRGREVFPPV